MGGEKEKRKKNEGEVPDGPVVRTQPPGLSLAGELRSCSLCDVAKKISKKKTDCVESCTSL